MLRHPLLILLFAGTAMASDAPRQIMWDQLVPEGWNPYAMFEKLSDEEYAALSDEQYFAMQDQVQQLLDTAPVVKELDGQTVRIPGFILPLEFDGTRISEFLLLPSRGACIHNPPPAANQIVRASLAQAFELHEMWRPVWVSGRLHTGHATTTLGEAGYDSINDIHSGYSMDVESIELYTLP